MIGQNAGNQLTLNDNGNICIAADGVVGDVAVTRIGQAQTSAYIKGIYGATGAILLIIS